MQNSYYKQQLQQQQSQISQTDIWPNNYSGSQNFSSQNLTNQMSNQIQQNLETKKFCEADFDFSDTSQMQEEGYEMSDLIQKFESLSKNNISKNIIKAFFSYLLDTKDNDLLIDFAQKGMQPTQARKIAKNYIKSYSYNNNSLHKLIQHDKYGKAFEFYLTFEAEKWLSESKVQQKKTHLIYIDFLKLCCSNPNYSNHIVTYKKNKKSQFSINE
ncbi:hypothetical protein ABPG72_017950 [Tetrahymena utriculariae]